MTDDLFWEFFFIFSHSHVERPIVWSSNLFVPHSTWLYGRRFVVTAAAAFCWKLTYLLAIFRFFFVFSLINSNYVIIIIFPGILLIWKTKNHMVFFCCSSFSTLTLQQATKRLYCPTMSWSCVLAIVSMSIFSCTNARAQLHSIKCLQIIFNLFLINGTHSPTPGTHFSFLLVLYFEWMNKFSNQASFIHVNQLIEASGISLFFSLYIVCYWQSLFYDS